MDKTAKKRMINDLKVSLSFHSFFFFFLIIYEITNLLFDENQYLTRCENEVVDTVFQSTFEIRYQALY